MKKFSAILLIFCMMMSMVTIVPTFAEDAETTTLTIQAEDTELIKGFYAHDDTLEAPKTDGDYVVYEPSGEWVSYDISFLKAGTYDVDLEYSLTAAVDQNFMGFDFIVDGALELKTYLPKSTTSKNAGKIYIPEGAKELKIKSNGIYTVKLKKAFLERTSALDTSEPIKFSFHDTTSGYDKTNKKAVVDILVDYYDKYCDATSDNGCTEKCDGTHAGAKAGGGYHFAFTNGNVVSAERVQYNPDEWSRYDVSDLKPGNYKVTLNIKVPRATATVSLKLGGASNDAPIICSIPQNSDYTDVLVGEMKITEDDKYLIVQDGGDYCWVSWLTFEDVGYGVSFDDENAVISGSNRAFLDSDYLFSIKTNTGAELDDVYAIAKSDGVEIPVNDLGNGNYSISKVNIRDNFTIYAKAIIEVSDAYKGKMDFLVDGNNLYTRTSHDDVYDLVQRFIGLKEQNLDKNEPFDFSTAGLIDKSASINSSYSLPLANGGDEAAPFNFNSSYIGANHGYSKGVLVTSTAHGKTYADIGSLWEDASGYRWNLLKVPNENQLLFLSENRSTSATKFSVHTDIAGDMLKYVSHGKNTGDITIESRAKNQQIYSANKYDYKKVYAVKGGIREEAVDGVLTNCDYVDFEEKYYIMNPVMIGATLRENRPEGGYTEPQSMAIGQPLVECVLTYRIMPDSTVLTIFEHKILEDINFNYYGGLQYPFNKFLNFKSGLYRYIPKSKEFTFKSGTEDITLDFTEPINMSNLTYPGAVSHLMTSDAWDENADSMPERQVDYAYNEANDGIAVSFSSGFLPIYDAEPNVRKTKTSAATYVYTSKKTYPYFVDALAFSETGTTNQIIKGVAYKKYNSADQKDITYYTIPYEGKTYVYVDCHEIAERNIQLSDILVPGANFAQIEKSDNVTYTVANDVLNVEMTNGTYGYLALCVDNPSFEAEVISVNATQGIANLSFKNNSSETKTSTLLIASYLNGRLKEIKPVTITIDPGVQYFFAENFTPNNFDKIKAFVWDDIISMSPVSPNGSGEVVPDYTTKYLGDGFTRINLKDTAFTAGTERAFKVDIKEDGEFAVFLNQVAAAANGYSVTFEKDNEVINAFEMPSASSSTYNTNYIRVGELSSRASGSVSLTKGVWMMKIKALLDVNISYIDIRSTIISVGNEALAIYPSDYNNYSNVDGGTYVSVEMNKGASSNPRAEGYDYYADYTNSELSPTHSSGRAILLSGVSQDHTYKAKVEKSGTYKIKVKFKVLATASKVAQDTDITLSMDVNGGQSTTSTHTFKKDAPAYSQSPVMECELVSVLDKGVNNINLKLNNFRAYLYELVVEPYEA